MDLSTQDILSDIRDAEETGESENVFYLYVATPRKPPKSIHRKVIEPYLKTHGWKKVSTKATGFRALYFLREKKVENVSDDGPSQSSTRCSCCHEIIADDNSESGDEVKMEENAVNKSPGNEKEMLNDSHSISPTATQKATNHRTELKRIIEEYKEKNGLSFHVHIVLSRPLDYEEDFAELASQPGSFEF